MSLDSKARKNLPDEGYYETIKRIRKNEGRCLNCGDKSEKGEYCDKCK
jgi:hypothetical protein